MGVRILRIQKSDARAQTIGDGVHKTKGAVTKTAP